MKPAFILHSPETGTDYRIYVLAPEQDESPGPWPAVLFLDGDDQFSAAVEAYQALRKTQIIPPLLLVGAGYGASYNQAGNRRGRDYTPTAHPDEPTSGGAGAFLNFLISTLWPELTRRYPIKTDTRGIGGHSLGSLLALYALWQETPFFTHYLASAPSLWWDDRSILRHAARRHEQNPRLFANLFLCVGTADTRSMTGDLTQLEQQLSARPFTGLRLSSERLAGRNHFDVLGEAFRAGLTALYGTASLVHRT